AHMRGMQAIEDAANTALTDGIAAENTWFGTTVDHAVVEAGAPERSLGGRDRHDLGMSRHVGVMFDADYRLCHHRVAATDQHPIGIFAGLARFLRKRDRAHHHPAVTLLNPCSVHAPPTDWLVRNALAL